MADPQKFTRTYSFTDYQASNPSAPLPGLQVDNELEGVETSIDEIVDAIKDVRRSDGALKNGIVTVDSLSPTVAAGVGAGALASAQAAAASADAASDSAVAAAASATAASGSATAASGYASNALTSRNEAETERTQAQSARTGAQTARDYAYQWSSAASGVDVNDGVNPVNKSAYHWAQVALAAAAGSIVDGSVTTAKLANGALSADTTGRAKMADGFVTSAKIADGTIATGDLADSSVTSAKIADGTIATGDIADSAIATAKLANGVLSADTTGRAKMADGYITNAKLDAPLAAIVNRAGASSAVTLSGTSQDIAIPANVSRVSIHLVGASSNGSSAFNIQLGDAGGIETTGYAGSAPALTDAAAVSVALISAGFSVRSTASGRLVHGRLDLVKGDGNTWTAVGSFGVSNSAVHLAVSGSKTLSDTLTTIRLATGNGTDVLNAGTMIATWS